MADPVLTDILAPAGRQDIEETLLAFLGDPDFLISDWHSGGVMRTLLELETQVLDDLIEVTIPLILSQGFADASDTDWLTAIAHGLYGLDRVLGTIARQTITIACDAANGPYTITAGAVFFTATDGRRYVAATGGTLSTSGTLALDVTGEAPGAALGLVNAVATPLRGVSLITAAITIISTVPQYGSNDESDQALIGRCLNRWPSLDVIGTVDRVEKWARAASTEVTRLRIDADATNPGGVVVTVASAGGAVTGGAVTAVQTYIDARAPITDYITAQNSSNLTITAGGTVTVSAALMPAAKLAADAAWIVYLSNAQIGGTVYLSQLLKSVMDAGAIDVSGLTLNAVAADVALSSTQVPVPNGSGLAALLAWNGV